MFKFRILLFCCRSRRVGNPFLLNKPTSDVQLRHRLHTPSCRRHLFREHRRTSKSYRSPNLWTETIEYERLYYFPSDWRPRNEGAGLLVIASALKEATTPFLRPSRRCMTDAVSAAVLIASVPMLAAAATASPRAGTHRHSRYVPPGITPDRLKLSSTTADLESTFFCIGFNV